MLALVGGRRSGFVRSGDWALMWLWLSCLDLFGPCFGFD